MELVAIALARVASFLEIEGIDPTGKTSTREACKRLADRYSFVKFPQTIEEFDFQKGIEFTAGKLGTINIDKMTIFGNGLDRSEVKRWGVPRFPPGHHF
ncbi:MAG: hypothetical protein LAQ69_25635 [Acidobacteriia bacterium]|nr:hypothetical protein [Terriglobia bacterium]